MWLKHCMAVGSRMKLTTNCHSTNASTCGDMPPKERIAQGLRYTRVAQRRVALHSLDWPKRKEPSHVALGDMPGARPSPQMHNQQSTSSAVQHQHQRHAATAAVHSSLAWSATSWSPPKHIYTFVSCTCADGWSCTTVAHHGYPQTICTCQIHPNINQAYKPISIKP